VFVAADPVDLMSSVLSVVYIKIEAEVLEFLLSHQYINKTCGLSGVRFLSALLMSK
jgi:hypothetical protein